MAAAGNLKQAFDVIPKPDVMVKSGAINRQYNAKTKKFVDVDVVEPLGYIVYTARGDALRVRNEEDLRKMKLHRVPEIVDMDSGDVVGHLQRRAELRSGHNLFTPVEETE